MYQHTIAISFDVRKEYQEDIKRFLELEQQLHEEFSPEFAKLDRDAASGEEGPARYSLTEKNCDGLTALLRRILSHPFGELTTAYWRMAIPAAKCEQAEWFVVWPATWTDIDGVTDEMVDVRADRIKGREQMRRYSEVPLMSEQWVAFTRQQKFTGIDFIWCRDKGKYAATQWYVPVSASFLGRGVDHPWFDPATRGKWKAGGFMVTQPTDPQWVIGTRIFDATQTRSGLQADSPAMTGLIEELRRTPARYSAPIEAPNCVLRQFLPNTDFAYMRIAQPHEPGDRRFRTVRLCCNALVRRKLLAAKLATPADFEPVEVLDAPPPGIGVFDSKDGPPPPPAFDAEQWAKVKKAEAKHRAKFEANPKPPLPTKAPDIRKLLPKLKRRLKAEASPIAKGARPEDIAAVEKRIGMAMPARWAELLAAIDGFTIDNCYALDGTAELRVAPTSRLVEEHLGNHDMIGSRDSGLPETHLGVASSDIGDCVFLDTAKLTPEGDCPVLFVNHETLETDASWPAIGIFLSDALEESEGE